MIKIILRFSIISSLLAISDAYLIIVATSPIKEESLIEGFDVPYIEAKNYFVKNNFKENYLTNPKICCQEDFDKVFGMAATMGKNGIPTYIDFSKQYVIAVVNRITDKSTRLELQSLKQKNNTIILRYIVKEGEKQISSIQPFLLLIVDNKYRGKIALNKLIKIRN